MSNSYIKGQSMCIPLCIFYHSPSLIHNTILRKQSTSSIHHNLRETCGKFGRGWSTSQRWCGQDSGSSERHEDSHLHCLYNSQIVSRQWADCLPHVAVAALTRSYGRSRPPNPPCGNCCNLPHKRRGCQSELNTGGGHDAALHHHKMQSPFEPELTTSAFSNFPVILLPAKIFLPRIYLYLLIMLSKQLNLPAANVLISLTFEMGSECVNG